MSSLCSVLQVVLIGSVCDCAQIWHVVTESVSRWCFGFQVAIKRACSHPEAKQVVLSQHSDAVMEALLKVQNSRTSVSEEVVMAMSVLCLEQGPDFSRYLQHIMPTILAGLSRHEDLEVCRICVNTIGDIAREVMEHVQPYADPCVPISLSAPPCDRFRNSFNPVVWRAMTASAVLA